MPGNYTGNSGNPTLSAPCNLSEPIDGDAATGASVESPVQSLADFATQVLDRLEQAKFSAAALRATLTTWTAFAAPTNGVGSNSSCIAFAPSLGTYGRLCAVGNNGAGTPVCQTSDDGGFTWTARASFATAMGANVPFSIMFAGGIFLACGAAGKIVTSSDGITWTSQTSNAGANALYSIAFASGIGSGYWAVSGASSTLVTAPLAATTWTAQATGMSAGTFAVAAIAGQFTACSSNAAVTNNTSISTNGTSWAASNGPAVTNGQIFAFNSNIGGTNAASTFVLVDTSSNFYSSTNGTSWTLHGFAAGSGMNLTWIVALAAGRSLLVIGGNNTFIVTTRDASIYQFRPHPAGQNNLAGACYAYGCIFYCTTTTGVWMSQGAPLNSTS